MPLFQFVSPKEVKEGKYIAKTPVTIRTSATIDAVKQALNSHVTAAPDKSELNVLNGMVYIVSQTEQHIVYACGNKLVPQIFVAEVVLSRNGDTTTGIFKVIRYLEQSGAVKGMDLMKPLRNEVCAAFRSVDPSAQITE